MRQQKNKITLGILAHVDAGKTTLSEGMLYRCGEIKRLGRVDHKDAYLDTSPLERERGITIFSKQAELAWKEREITLLDTPGHVDFSAETERTLQVLDYAVLVISGTDGVQGHTETLWRLLERFGVPVFIFVNKMDMPGTDRGRLMEELRSRLSDHCVDFTEGDSGDFLEDVAVCDEMLLEKYLEEGSLTTEDMAAAVAGRGLFPCFFGSALKLEGVDALLDGISSLSAPARYGDEFGARVYKITRDDRGTRLTHMKLTGGELRVRDVIGAENDKDEKVNQIRIYSGEKYETAEVVGAGEICAVTGPDLTYSGQGLGAEKDFMGSQMEPVLNYDILFPEGTDMGAAFRQLRQLEEEDPKLHITWDDKLRRMQIQPMGEIQLEVLQELARERFGMEISFGEGSIRYRETIRDAVEGVGHFEPLRHYAEVHLWMEPLPPGSGMELMSVCSEDKLDLNWQRLVLTHLAEREFPGVLTGSSITDMRITLAAGKAHLKHTEGGDFRQATYRAVRQGLMKAESVLLEPVYRFRLELPTENIGRAMTDIKRMDGEFETEPDAGDLSVLTGTCPVATMKGYPREVAAYTKGRGHIFCELGGYVPCHNAEEVIGAFGYDPESDVENPADSVFCSHGAGIVVKWNEVDEHMHLESVAGQFRDRESRGEEQGKTTNVENEGRQKGRFEAPADPYAEDRELAEIFERTFGPVKRRPVRPERREIRGTGEKRRMVVKEREPVEDYLLVDGYNIIFAWEDLRELSETSLDAARQKLMDMMCNYQGYTNSRVIVVFDAYRVKGNPGSVETYHNISVVYTREAETADMYIEKTTRKIAKNNRVRVATSDALEQMIVLGHGATRISARTFREEMERIEGEIRERLEGEESND